MVKTALLIFSGGMDSATLLFKLLSDGYDEIHTITFDYGQRHRKEIEAATTMIGYLQSIGENVIQDVVDVKPVFRYIDSSALTNNSISVPQCHYTDDSAKVTVVPNRNQILLSIASGIAAARGIHEVFYAAHSGDHAIYPDCTVEFFESLKNAISISTRWHPVELKAPFIHISKADIMRIGLDLKVPYELTWSCYEGGEKPCGVCPTCVERIESFKLNGLEDPLEY